MTQRQKNASQSLNMNSVMCEKYMAKLMSNDRQLNQLLSAPRNREKAKTTAHEHQVMKSRQTLKQQNIISSPPKGMSRTPYADDSVVEVTVKSLNMPTRPRSKSTTQGGESWSQLLKHHTSGDKVSIFGNFDPLRTLHFLAKELQLRLENLLPGDVKIQQMITDMQYALKRVPPEVASQVLLHQAMEGSNLMLSSGRRSETIDCGVQTEGKRWLEENGRLQKMMAEGTIKLEASCRQMEKLCTDLKNEKNALDAQLARLREENEGLKTKVDDLDNEKNNILNPRISTLVEEKLEQQNYYKDLMSKSQSQYEQTVNDLKSQVTELKCQKNGLEQQCNKLKHQIKIAALEREKFVAILALRDSQINEIRTEMTQLQELVNEQLMEMHTNAFQDLPCEENNTDNLPDYKLEQCEYKESGTEVKLDDNGDSTISSILTNEDDRLPTPTEASNAFVSLKPSEMVLPELDNIFSSLAEQDQKSSSLMQLSGFDKRSCHTSIKTMFDEIKKTAYAVVDAQRENNYK